MNPTAIFSKSGKGVQEASGKTSQLSRPDRAVLSAIDGRVTLGDVAQKVGKQFDNEFQALIKKLDKDGFIREVSPGAAAPAGAKGAPAKPAAPSKPTAPMDMASDLDFTATMAVPKKTAAAPPPQSVARAPAPPPKPTVNVPPPPPPPSAAEKAKQAVIAKEQQSAFARAREEAEQKAQEQRDRVKSEAEAKIRAETEVKMRAEAEQKMKADAEAAAKRAEAEAAAARSAAIRAAAEAKIKAEAEAKRAREEAERAKREAEEKAERARREAEEKARREQEELKRKLEEERRAREEAERRAKEEAERARRELEEERRKMEAERKQREEQQRREDEERAARRKQEEEEAERRRQREEQELRELAEQALQAKPPEPAPPPPAPKAKPAATGDAFADSLLADLDSFTQREDDERKAKDEADRKAKEEVARKKREESERQEREAAEARQREESERRRREEEAQQAAQQAREEEERRVRRQREEEEQAEREAEERRRKMAAGAPASAGGDDIGITDADLELDEVKREQALLEKKKNRKEEREKEREKERQKKLEQDREAKSKKAKEREEKEAKKAVAYRPRRKSHLGRNIVLGLFVLVLAGVGVLHVMPVSTAEYERAATEALGVPVRIGAGHFSMIGGVQYKFEGVTIGSVSVPTVRAYPELGSLFDDKKVFTRVELEGMSLPQETLGEVLFAREKSDNLKVPRVTLRNLKLSGPLPLPPLDGELQLDGGALRTATLRGPEGLVAKLDAKGDTVQFDVSTAQFTLPFAPGITLVQFAMKGDATRHGLKISQWDGLLFSGHVTGTANMRWGSTWSVEGVVTARGMNAAVFAPALVSDGRVEGTGRFSMSGVEPVKLAAGARLEGNFTVQNGVLGSFDLSKALQTAGRQTTGQTQFAEMSGQGVYERGTVSLRNVNLGAGALNAGASAEVDERGGLSGRIVADVKTSTQNLRATLILGGTVQEPQVRN
jgi:hypothetical protein